ncbi:DUF418 domain-containing protein [Paenibacillus tundrae]|nr:DUF418 domain-containing protein [Paenibacillus tundrae]
MYTRGGSSPLDRIIRTIKKKLPVWEASSFFVLFTVQMGQTKKGHPFPLNACSFCLLGRMAFTCYLSNSLMSASILSGVVLGAYRFRTRPF